MADGMGWDGMGWDGMGWDGMGFIFLGATEIIIMSILWKDDGHHPQKRTTGHSSPSILHNTPLRYSIYHTRARERVLYIFFGGNATTSRHNERTTGCHDERMMRDDATTSW